MTRSSTSANTDADHGGHGACWAQIHDALEAQDAETDARLKAYLDREKRAKDEGLSIGCTGERLEDRTSPTGNRRRLSPEQRERARRLHAQGVTYSEIARRFSCGYEAVRSAVRVRGEVG